MNTYSYISILIALIAFISKCFLVREKSSEKSFKKEFIIDVIRIPAVFILTNVFWGWNYSVGKLIIDVFMLVAYLSEYNEYSERKAVTGICAGFMLYIILFITITEIFFGIYDENTSCLYECFKKVVVYLATSMWGCFTCDEKGLRKITVFFKTIFQSFLPQTEKYKRY